MLVYCIMTSYNTNGMSGDDGDNSHQGPIVNDNREYFEYDTETKKYTCSYGRNDGKDSKIQTNDYTKDCIKPKWDSENWKQNGGSRKRRSFKRKSSNKHKKRSNKRRSNKRR